MTAGIIRRRSVTLHKGQGIKPSSGTRIPPKVRDAVKERDRGRCLGRLAGFPTVCDGSREMDHVRASGGMGMKSASTLENLASLCFVCHRWKTEHGKEARPMLLAVLELLS